ncbi:uncharacterized protein N7529_008057 [Penicillium soppii]|uniref:uncharacterized protein n=1 Tax=Penicillium soppii TaxID=69789 RepID=UPI0025470D5E|nr:uncharacterized protein N7529_008057 [Penicillium soppii]KAJ5860747.1 hypothetical protein N7529_008057 [Penicillium soppii]
MDTDKVKTKLHDTQTASWIKTATTSSKAICTLAGRYRGRPDCWLRSLHRGTHNFSWRLHWDDGGEDWLIRFPLPGKTMSDAKVVHEVIAMQYVAANTDIPVPRVVAHGTANENPTGLGPFVIMTWVEGRTVADIIAETGLGDVDPKVLRVLYTRMAEVLLHLWSLEFDMIGNLGSGESGFCISGSPWTREMNELVRAYGIDIGVFGTGVYHSSTDYVASLLGLQSVQLEQQRNSVYDAADCRMKYATRHLMKALALKFINRPDNHGPFKLFCDEFGPGNVLLDDQFRVTGVIDWEFCYAAPAQFAGSIPSWLLLQRPHDILNDQGADAFLSAFMPKADLFLECLEWIEQQNETQTTSNRLSVRMRQSIQDKSAWFILACRNFLAVDTLYWELLDDFCWGAGVSIEERVRQFTASDDGMLRVRERFVRRKILQLRDYQKEFG